MEFKLFIAGLVFFVIAMIMLRTKKKRKIESKAFATIYSWVDTAWTALLAASVIMFFIIQAFKIPSGSMRNTFLEGDHLFVNKFIYGFHIPLSSARVIPIKQVQRGDIVVFKAPNSALSPAEIAEGGKDFIKRCVAISGDTVEIKNKLLFINGEIADEPYVVYGDNNLYPKAVLFDTDQEYQKAWEIGVFAGIPGGLVRDNFGPITVPEGHYMMLGDNRDYSFDSRFWGPLSDSYIKGKALFRYWPLTRIKVI
ncbi:MAG: signal peptidase I [Elusimicrobiota bacterium]|jgi:signal peptidase I|nr:signal peptidase I [Elusimicrobiota bacterium]